MIIAKKKTKLVNGLTTNVNGIGPGRRPTMRTRFLNWLTKKPSKGN